MAFPRTFDEIKAAGYRQYDGDDTCRQCGQAIEWWVAATGEKMAVNAPYDGRLYAADAHGATCDNPPERKK